MRTPMAFRVPLEATVPDTDTQTPDKAVELRKNLAETGDKLAELRSLPADKRGDTFKNDVREAIDTIHTLDAELTAAERSIARQVEDVYTEVRGPQAAFALFGDREERTPGDTVVDSDAYKAFLDGSGSRLGGAHEVRTLLTSSTTDPAAGLWRPVGTPLPPNVRQRRLFVRDLLTVQQTGLASVPYIREVGSASLEGGASAVSEGSAKAEVAMGFSEADAPARKIAAWIPVTDEILADAPTLRGYINTRLIYMLAIREEYEVLNGNGVAPHIDGILNQGANGLQTQTAVSGDYPATIALAIGKVENVDGAADGVVANPLDYWTAVAKRHSDQFDNGFGGGAPATVGGITWGLPAVRTRGIASGKAIVADWSMGATLFDRMQSVIKTADQHSDYFTKNLLVILAEERVALAIWRPDFFVDVTVPTS